MSLRVACYLRVSTESQSTEIQRRDIEIFIKNRDWTVIEFYEDKLSGATTKRPSLQRLLKDAHSKKFDVVVTYRLDRFFRSLKDLLTTIHELRDNGIDFVSIKDNIDLTTSSGRLMLHLLGAIAQFERELIHSRVMAGLQNARKKGIKLGRPQVIPIEDVLILRKAGLSLGQIAKKLRVSKSAVHKTLKNNPVPKSSNNIEIIENPNPEKIGHKTLGLGTIDKPPKENIKCHERDKKCHEGDLHVTSDMKESRK